MNLDIKVTQEKDKSVVKLFGEIDAYTAPDLKDTLLPLATHEGQTIEVDLENVSYMDSTGLGVFVSALKATREVDSHLKLIKLQDRVLRLFTITGLNEVIDIDSEVRGGN
ncbi:STAS domain-containing protein [Radiobacillus kanasensis]|uniref:STAS domain-containing protein n=1 Tax=Radiobacillus kanasensis TaxID=2844358 RepID=UPI001E500567|nr:STAS domain-containing protein [Radiobacillus kanasensis]UFT99826.1 STAS domain-containing protein [Radiobacillus kanasensis]